MPAPLVVRAKDARAIGRGHPWVYRQALSRKAAKVKPGTVVDLMAENGGFLGRGLFDPGDSVAVRVWTRDERVRIDHALLVRRLREAADLRERTGLPGRSDAYRVANSEGDRLPGLVVDRYGDWLTITLQTRALASWTRAIVGALSEAVPARGIYLLDDKHAALQHGDPAPEELVVEESTGRFVVDLTTPGKSGLFMDMREVRERLAPLVVGKRFLNLFAHTGAFSAAAARAGAAEVVSVDLSAHYLSVASRNVELSAPGYDAHEVVAGDAFDALRRMQSGSRRFDAILIDPPTFSSSKASGAFSVKDNYRPLVRSALRVLEPGGLLVCATNWRGITNEQFLRLLHDAAETEHTDLRILEVIGQPRDYPFLPMLPESAHLHVILAVTGG